MSDRTRFSPAQLRAARGLLDWSVDRLAEAADLECEAITLFETAEGELSPRDMGRLGRALNMNGVIAIAGDRAGPGVRFRRPAGAGCDDWMV